MCRHQCGAHLEGNEACEGVFAAGGLNVRPVEGQMQDCQISCENRGRKGVATHGGDEGFIPEQNNPRRSRLKRPRGAHGTPAKERAEQAVKSRPFRHVWHELCSFFGPVHDRFFRSSLFSVGSVSKEGA